MIECSRWGRFLNWVDRLWTRCAPRFEFAFGFFVYTVLGAIGLVAAAIMAAILWAVVSEIWLGLLVGLILTMGILTVGYVVAIIKDRLKIKKRLGRDL